MAQRQRARKAGEVHEGEQTKKHESARVRSAVLGRRFALVCPSHSTVPASIRPRGRGRHHPGRPSTPAPSLTQELTQSSSTRKPTYLISLREGTSTTPESSKAHDPRESSKTSPHRGGVSLRSPRRLPRPSRMWGLLDSHEPHGQATHTRAQLSSLRRHTIWDGHKGSVGRRTPGWLGTPSTMHACPARREQMTRPPVLTGSGCLSFTHSKESARARGGGGFVHRGLSRPPQTARSAVD